MNEPEHNSREPLDPLDALLRASRPTLADEGFTTRVLLALPPRRRGVSLRLALLVAALLGGTLLLGWLGPEPAGGMSGFLQAASRGDLRALPPLLPALVGLGSLACGLTAVALEEDWA